MSLSVAQLNTIAQEVAQAIGHCSQELLLEIHAKLKEAVAETAATPSTDA